MLIIEDFIININDLKTSETTHSLEKPMSETIQRKFKDLSELRVFVFRELIRPALGLHQVDFGLSNGGKWANKLKEIRQVILNAPSFKEFEQQRKLDPSAVQDGGDPDYWLYQYLQSNSLSNGSKNAMIDAFLAA